MKGRTCDNCQKWISARFGTCPYCKSEQSPIHKSPGIFSWRSPIWVVLLVLTSAVSVLASLGREAPERGAAGPTDDMLLQRQLSDAAAMCRSFVEGQLKAPATAKWPYLPVKEYVTKTGTSTYRARSYVDSKNAFGVMLRTHYDCLVEEDAGRWKLIGLQAGDASP